MIDTFIPQLRRLSQNYGWHVRVEFIVNETALVHVRGQEKLTRFAQARTIKTKNEMANYLLQSLWDADVSGLERVSG